MRFPWVSQHQLERVTIDTTVQTKAVSCGDGGGLPSRRCRHRREGNRWTATFMALPSSPGCRSRCFMTTTAALLSGMQACPAGQRVSKILPPSRLRIPG